MLIGKKREKSVEIPNASLSDIVFLLLIFFLVTTSIDSEKGLDLVLPPPNEETIEIGPIILYVRHNPGGLDVGPDLAGFKAVITGHTHRAEVYEKNGICFLNPGSASYPKFGNPASAGLIQIRGEDFSIKLVRLKN